LQWLRLNKLPAGKPTCLLLRIQLFKLALFHYAQSVVRNLWLGLFGVFQSICTIFQRRSANSTRPLTKRTRFELTNRSHSCQNENKSIRQIGGTTSELFSAVVCSWWLFLPRCPDYRHARSPIYRLNLREIVNICEMKPTILCIPKVSNWIRYKTEKFSGKLRIGLSTIQLPKGINRASTSPLRLAFALWIPLHLWDGF